MPHELLANHKTESLSDALQHDVNRLSAVIEEGIQRFKGPFAAGAKFTGLDAFLAPMVVRAVGYQLPVSPLSREYVDHLLRNPWLTDGFVRPEKSPGESLMRMKRTSTRHSRKRLSNRATVIDSARRPAFGSRET